MDLNKYLNLDGYDDTVTITLKQERELKELIKWTSDPLWLLDTIDHLYDDNSSSEKREIIHIEALRELPKQYLKKIILSQRYTVVDTLEERLAYREQLLQQERRNCGTSDYSQGLIDGKFEVLERIKEEYKEYLNSLAKVDTMFRVREDQEKLVLVPNSRVKVKIEEDGTIVARPVFHKES
ncbi:hypothetical protein 010DV004_69 [Bacillus phage 010DV004]|nr:hypothetical protein 010DV004_69 [Bacillus phage 010DV004]QZA69286.1 hypothetical protein 010DV005_69 [Bacillus phage 010DV005]QZA69854.1 hypothetical protein 043JT007_68 [Bacillus phage 043JT007]